MNRRQWLRTNPSVMVVGECKNEHGEVFVIYTIGNEEGFYITGDELDWNTGWMWNGRNVVQTFVLSSQEAEMLQKIIIEND